MDTIWITVIAEGHVNLDHYFVGPIYRQSIGDLQRIAGLARTDALPDLTNAPGVIGTPGIIGALTADDVPLPPQPDEVHTFVADPLPSPENRSSFSGEGLGVRHEPPVPGAPTGWYENDTQGVRETWNTLHLDGAGVTIAVLDSGADFGNPALNGRYAVQTTTLTGSQAYVGWPIAYDDRSLGAYLANPASANNWGWYVNAARTLTGTGAFTFTIPGKALVYTAPSASLSGRYYQGTHPDPTLTSAPVLVADTVISGTYDAVFMDLNADGQFETRLTRDQPVGVIDLSGDGVADTSAGMIYWISDGVNPPPGSTGLYGPNVPIPASGRLVAFMIDSLSFSGGGHGTECASTAVGNDGGVFTPEPRVTSFYTATYGPLVQGPAPAAKIIAIGNVYAGGSIESAYLFIFLGYDGMPHTGDEPQIATLSYGTSGIDNDTYDWESRYITYLARYYEEQAGVGAAPLFIHSAGNGGYGNGTLIQPNPLTALTVGAATQYGTINAWGISETVSAPQRVNYGDIVALSDRGPAADGVRAVDLVANGHAGTGAYPLNVNHDGTRAYVHWTGTSRSGPVVAGIGALVAQGFHQVQGRWPTADELRRLLINSGRDLGHEVMAQGAGQANAFRAAQAALNQYGLIVDPPTITVDELPRGQTATRSIQLRNPGPAAITATLRAQQLIELAHYTATINTITDTATNYNNGIPDYALNLTPWITAHADADLMVVKLTVPFEHFDTVPPSPAVSSNNWRLMVYNWWDLNNNQQWWTDLNANTRVDLNEIDPGDEWLRFDYSRLAATQQQISVGFPYTRSIGAGSGGVWAGASHFVRSAGDNRTTLTFDVIFYRHADWPEVQIDAPVLAIPPQSTVDVTVTLLAPPDAAYGLHAGTLVISDTGRLDLDPTYRPRDLNVPISWQVSPDPASGSVIIDRAQGGFSWGGRGEEGDWHFYRFTLNDPPPGSILLAHTQWIDYPTDLDTLILGPGVDSYSTVAPQWFGPYTLNLTGGSLRSGARPSWNFRTNTGRTEEWVAVQAGSGPHMVIEQAVLLGGHQAQVPFTTSLGLAHVEPYPLRLDPNCGLTCTITATFHSTIDLSGTIALSHGYGWYTPTLYTGVAISQGQSVPHGLLVPAASYDVEVTLENVVRAGELNLSLYSDRGLIPGAWDALDWLMMTTNGPGVDKALHIRSLLAGQYWVVVNGQHVEPEGGQYDLEVEVVPTNLDGGFIAHGLPDALAAGQAATFTLEVTRPPLNGQRGDLVLSPAYLTGTMDVPVHVEPLPNVWISQTVPPEVIPGVPFSVTLVYGNDGLSDAHDAAILHTLWLNGETAITHTQVVTQLSAGQVQTWTIGIEPPADLVSLETKSSVSIDAREFDPDRSNNARSVVQPVRPQANVWATITAGTAEPVAGTVLTYTAAFGNAGPSAAQAVRVASTLPVSVTTVQPLTESLDWLLPGMTYTTTVFAEADPAIGESWPLTASIAVASTTPDLQPDDNQAAASGAALTRTDLWAKTYVVPSTQADRMITYVLFGNYGPSDAHGVWVHDILPPGVTATEPTSRHFAVVRRGEDNGWYMTITLSNSIGSGITLTNQVYATGLDTDPFTENNSTAAVFISPYQTFLPLVLFALSD
ncbi:MAG: S8 family serine peptidase [Chloroflexi bacterium]|nr:S8 family serine peptidase [Chloroflexota bacterium]